MFIVTICGGPYDGEPISEYGWPTFGLESPRKFENLSEVKDWIASRQPMVDNGDYGVGASLVLNETSDT